MASTNAHTRASGVRYPERSRAILAMAIGLMCLFTGGLSSPLAWWIASRDIKAIDAGRRDPRFLRWAEAARTLGVVGTAVAAAVWTVFVLAFAVVAVSEGY